MGEKLINKKRCYISTPYRSQSSQSQSEKERYFYKIPYTRKEFAFLRGLRIETVIRTFKKIENEPYQNSKGKSVLLKKKHLYRQFSDFESYNCSTNKTTPIQSLALFC